MKGMLSQRYRWVPTGAKTPCTCQVGWLRGYRVEPERSPVYLNLIAVCDNPNCKEAKNRRGEGRLILA